MEAQGVGVGRGGVVPVKVGGVEVNCGEEAAGMAWLDRGCAMAGATAGGGGGVGGCRLRERQASQKAGLDGVLVGHGSGEQLQMSEAAAVMAVQLGSASNQWVLQACWLRRRVLARRLAAIVLVHWPQGERVRMVFVLLIELRRRRVVCCGLGRRVVACWMMACQALVLCLMADLRCWERV